MPDNTDLQQALGFFTPTNPQMPTDPGDLAALLGYSPSQQPTPDVSSQPLSEQFPHPDYAGAAPTSPASPTSPATPSSPGLPPNTSAAAGAKVSESGYNPAANAAIQRGPHAAVDQQMARDRAEVQAQIEPIQREYHSAAVTGEQAAIDQGALEAKKLAVTAEARGKIAAANMDFMAKEKAAADNARAESMTNMANYRSAIADYAASQVNPSQLWENAGKAGQVGMVATAFIHDFLAAKGIQTTGLESLNKAIQQNISSQLDNMRKKLDVAQGFKQLWDMQRAQSATDAEARQRMNGFYLAALDNQVQAQMGSYDSQLAIVKAQAAKAAIQQEMAKNDLLVQKHIDDAAQQRASDRVHMYSAELTASSAKYAADAHVKAALINAKGMVSPLQGVIFDTSQSGGNLAKRRLLPDIKPDEATKIRQQASNVYTTVGNIERLIDLQDKIAKVPPDIGIEAFKRMQSEENRVAELVRNSVKMGIIYDNSGKQINEQEVKLYDEIVGKKDWWLNGDNVRTLGTLAKGMLDKQNAMLSGVSTEILPGDPAYGVTSGNRNMAPGEQALTEVQSSENAGRHVNTSTEDAIKQVTSPKASEDAYSGPGIVDKAKELIGTKAPYNKETGSGMDNQEWQDRQAYKQFLDQADIPAQIKQANSEPSKSFVGIVKLGDAAKAGDSAAVEALHKFADKPPQGDSLVSYYAQWELAQISK